ncbi:MAG: AI-2E family transporter [Phycisphaerae bacterium]|nr:AI-2E family transporter [Phycisphaerae bacterium]
MLTRPRSDAARLVRLLTFVTIVAVLYLGRAILIPVALSVLVAFILTPVVKQIQRGPVPRWLAVTVTVVASIGIVAFVGWIVAVQTLDLAENLPQYRGQIREKTQSLVGDTDSWMFRARRGLAEVHEQVRDATATLGDPADEKPAIESAPFVVSVPQDESGPISSLVATLLTVVNPLLAAGIVLVFTSFILVKSEDLRDRALALMGADQLRVSTQVMDDAAENLSRFLFAQLIINAAFALLFGVGLFVIGVPNAFLFGAMAIPLRFVPIVGPWILAALPVLLALIVLKGWWPPFATLALFMVLELATLYVVEPWAYGKRTGLSTPAVLLALVFWTWLWGGAGLVLAMPITLCIAVFGRHVRSLPWLSILLDDLPALPPSSRVYQRLLALDIDEAVAVAKTEQVAHGVAHAFDEVIVPALAMIEHDRQTELVTPEQTRFAIDGVGEIVAALMDSTSEVIGPHPHPDSALAPPKILCVPARSDADGISAKMLAHVVRTRGGTATALPASSSLSDRLSSVQESDAEVVCVCAMPPWAESHAKFMAQRIAGAVRGKRVILGIWSTRVSDAAMKGTIATAPSRIATTLDAAANAAMAPAPRAS